MFIILCLFSCGLLWLHAFIRYCSEIASGNRRRASEDKAGGKRPDFAVILAGEALDAEESHNTTSNKQCSWLFWERDGKATGEKQYHFR
ncbi:MAG: hypothetical protein ACAH83_04335 [Alphaproteobacteria bacterium]